MAVDIALTISLHILNKLRDPEKVVHLLKRQALGLGNKEPDKDKHGEAEGTVGEEGAVKELAKALGIKHAEMKHTHNRPCPW